MTGSRGPLVIMVTSRFPYGTGEQFIESELPVWADSDMELLILPEKNDAPQVAPRTVPAGITVDSRLTARWTSPRWRALGALESIISGVLPRDLVTLAHRHQLDKAHLMFSVRTAVQVSVVRRMLRTLAAERGPADVVYAYWLGPSAAAAALERRAGHVRHAVARTHNADVYEERHPLGYHPVVRQISGDLDLLLPISQDGGAHAVELYGFPPSHVHVSRLGVTVPDPTERCQATPQGEFTILSVSTMTPFKRLDLLIGAIAELHDLRPDLAITWRHAGTGPLREELVRLAKQELVARGVTVDWMGQLPNEVLLEWYRNNPVDVLLNTSSSEGVPVSMMEAMARGVPTIGTDVGGVREILLDDWLMGPDPTPAEVARFIADRVDRAKDPRVRAAMSDRIHQEYDSTANFHALTGLLRDLALGDRQHS